MKKDNQAKEGFWSLIVVAVVIYMIYQAVTILL